MRLSLLLSKKGEPKRCTVIRILGYAIILLFAYIYISDMIRYSTFIPEGLLFCVLSIAAVFVYLIILENILYSSAILKSPSRTRTVAAFAITMFIPVAMTILLVFSMNLAFNNDMSKSEISKYVSNNTSELIECVNYFKENDTAFVRLGKDIGMSPDDEVFIITKNQSKYLSAENEMIKELFKDGIRYQEPGGDNEFYLEPLTGNFYYYNMKI